MAQYQEQKTLHPDKILFFRMGDFYELFDQDAITAAPILGIALTVRNRKAEDNTKMCGVPHHSVAGPINKLLSEGFKVAICDQLEDPKQAKGIVKRGVTRILSPGMVYDPETLDASKANYLCSYDESTIAFLEASTGEAFYYDRSEKMQVAEVLRILQPSELVLSDAQKQEYLANKKQVGGPLVTAFDLVEEQDDMPAAFLRLKKYAVNMQGDGILSTIQPLEKRRWHAHLQIDAAVIQHLELLESYNGEKKNSFFQHLNRCKTSAGSRLWKKSMLFPLLDVKEILLRQNKVRFWVDHFHPGSQSPGVKAVREKLSHLGDVERRLGKISHPNSSPRDLQSLALSLEAGLELCAMTDFFRYDVDAVKACDSLVQEIHSALKDTAPTSLNKDYFIKKGYRSSLDEWIELTEEVEGQLATLQEEERQKSDIPSLKIKHNNVFGYYAEVTNTHKAKVPKHYQRKQTLTNAERYTFSSLQELEEKILKAKAKRFELETGVFQELREKVLKNAAWILALAQQWAEIDFTAALALLAVENRWSPPIFSDAYQLEGLRHPVVEKLLSNPFVANDIDMNSGHIHLLTGPNMAGKSTFMRQVAIASILAQMGSYVPAKTAKMPIIDRIFTRIGASDDASEGLSTFMVEMRDCSHIFRHKSRNSLIIMDEVGRGTSTYDGMSLAQAILEKLAEDRQGFVLFSTHYHELTKMQAKYENVHNYHMSIAESKGRLRFLYKIKKGAAGKSYGVHVADLAGMPKSVVDRAKSILQDLEKQSPSQTQMDLFSSASLDLVENVEDTPHPLVEELANVDLNQMSPMDALNWLHEKKLSLN